MTPKVECNGLDITEGVQTILDALNGSMDAGSGFLDYREVLALRQVAYALGLNPDDFTPGAPGGYWVDSFSKHLSKEMVSNIEAQRTTFLARFPDPTLPLTDEPDRNHEDD